MSVLDWCLVVSSALAASWWVFAEQRARGALRIVSIGVLVLAGTTLAVEGVRWQLVPWQILGVIVATLAMLRRRRPNDTHDWRARGTGVQPPDASRAQSSPVPRRWLGLSKRGLLLATVAIGAWALLWVFVPTLPTPSGPYHVGTEVFHWTDTSRHETLGPDHSQYRQVVAQAWYPTDATQGHMAPYFEEPGKLPGMGGLPAFVFSDAFRDIATHGILAAPVSAAQRTWPVLLFSPGLELPRELYTGLCTELASRGYVVVALSSPYESAVTELANGAVVHSELPSDPSEAQLFELVETRAADASFALDQLGRLKSIDPHSALVDRLDLGHVGIFGHSLGGASAVQALEEDPRFRVAVNLDGSLWGDQPSYRLDRPLLWVESSERSGEEDEHARDQLLSGLKDGGALVKITHSLHMSFTDEPSYLTSLGRALLGHMAGMGKRSLATMATLTAQLISAFVGPELGVRSSTTLSQVAVENSAIELERQITPTRVPPNTTKKAGKAG
jgi:predicted dienelactone hydrolase